MDDMKTLAHNIRIVSTLAKITCLIIGIATTAYAFDFSKMTKWNELNISEFNMPAAELQFPPHRLFVAESVSNNFENSETCGSCHVEIYQQWERSMMSKSWEDPFYRALLKKASEATKGDLNNFCAGCHSPIGLATGKITDVTVRQTGDANTQPLPGVDCESCHTISDITGTDNGAFVLTPSEGRPKKYGPRKGAVSPYHDTEYSEIHTQSAFCSTCHNVTHPFTKAPIERTYDEWLESPYSDNGIGCQDCHMPRFKGKAAIMGPERNDVAGHQFAGANSTVLSHLGETEQADLARDMLRGAATMEFVSLPAAMRPRDMVNVIVKVKNVGAGHKLPTGFPEGREVWIDFQVFDGNHQRIYRLGKIENGKTEEGTKNFKIRLGDRQGNEVLWKVWNVTHVLSDNRILPKGQSLETFSFVVPEDSTPPYRIEAELNYWPFSQYLADKIIGEGEVEVDIVKMVGISTTVDNKYRPVAAALANTQPAEILQ